LGHVYVNAVFYNPIDYVASASPIDLKKCGFETPNIAILSRFTKF